MAPALLGQASEAWLVVLMFDFWPINSRTTNPMSDRGRCPESCPFSYSEGRELLLAPEGLFVVVPSDDGPVHTTVDRSYGL